jgi:hypothetical protein
MSTSKEYFSKDRYPPYLYFCTNTFLQEGQQDDDNLKRQPQQKSVAENDGLLSRSLSSSSFASNDDKRRKSGTGVTARRSSSYVPTIQEDSDSTNATKNTKVALGQVGSSSPNFSSTELLLSGKRSLYTFSASPPSAITVPAAASTSIISVSVPPQPMSVTSPTLTSTPNVHMMPPNTIMNLYCGSPSPFLLLQQGYPSIKPTWRLKERMKTVGICLVLALNIGTDPPDTYKPTPCAKLQTWFDPTTISRSKARERIAERLEAQYSNWQPRTKLKCKRALDPTIEEVRALCLSMRRGAKNERVLLHYNGHGVPRCTANGEIWLFDKNHTQYIPLSVLELKSWLGKPSVIVLDCSNAGVLVPFFVSHTSTNTSPASNTPQRPPPDLNIPGREGSSNNLMHIVGASALDGDAPTNRIDGFDQIRNRVAPVQEKSTSGIATEEELDPDATWAANTVREFIVLAPCAEGQLLPMNPDYPADLFTSCLTTPIPVALRWFIRKNPLSMEGVNPDVVDFIPGKTTDRKTPLGELNWIFTAITDTIAWNVLPSSLFQRLFRQDLLVASLFRNFLLADRILRSFKCTPVSHPAIPTATWNHPLWEAWDLSVETCLYQLLKKGSLGLNTLGMISTDIDRSGVESSYPSGMNAISEEAEATNATTPSSPRQHQASDAGDSSLMALNVSSPFFSEQLTAFELWVEFALCRYGDHYGITKTEHVRKKLEDEALQMNPPEQLPVVLQVLLSQAHRVRALVLLRRFLDLGPYAVNLALSVGIFPYVLKLLQSHIDEYKHVLVGIWAKILAFDPSCRIDLVKDGALSHFIEQLYFGLHPSIDGSDAFKVCNQDTVEQRTMAAFILSSICFDYPIGQADCLKQNLHVLCRDLLLMAENHSKDRSNLKEEEKDAVTSNSAKDEDKFPSIFKRWICICLGNMLNEMVAAQTDAFSQSVHVRLFSFLRDDCPSVRSAVAFALGSLIGNQAITNAITARLPALNESRKICGPETNLPPQRFSLSSTNVNGVHRSFEQVTISSQSLQGGIMDQKSFQVDKNASFEAESEPCLSPEERTRLSLDLIVARQLISLASDASPAVRYETVLALGCCIEKYLPMFAEVANDNAKVSSNCCRVETKTDQELTFMPSLVSQKLSAAVGDENARDIRSVWGVIRDLQCRDPFPIVSDTAKVVVSFVHEYMLLLLGTPGESKNMAAMNRIHSMLQMNSSSADNPANITKKMIDSTIPIPHQVTSFDANKLTIRRQSLGKTERPILDRYDSLSKSYHGRVTVRPEFPSSNDYVSFDKSQADYQSQYKLPRSQFFLWHRSKFGQNPKVVQGISSGYSERRNTLIRSHIKSLAEKFEIISRDNVDNYKKIQSSGSFSSLSNSKDFFSDLESEEEESAKAAALEAEISTKKKGLQLKQRTLLHKEGCATSTMLKFHPYEPALLVCDASDVVSLWNINDAKEYCSFHNGNDKDSRLTTISWVNEESKSLLITGATDGTLRIWEGLLRDDCSLSNEAPNLISAFLAEPDIVAGTKGSDLIMEWQQCTGKLVTAGSSALLRCWDIETEKCCNEIDRNSEASVTALCTAWDSLFLDNENKLNPTIGPDILVTGYSDGSIRIFDTRVDYRNLSSSISMGHSFSSRQRKRKVIQYHEHNSWIVNTCFTGFGAKYEVSEGIQSRRVQLFPPMWLGITN